MDSRKVIRDVLGDYDDVMSAISEIQPAESVEIRGHKVELGDEDEHRYITITKEGEFIAKIWI